MEENRDFFMHFVRLFDAHFRGDLVEIL